MAGNKPDYKLHGMIKGTDEKNRIGAGWTNPDGSIRIKLDSFIAISSNPELVLTLFPEDRSK